MAAITDFEQNLLVQFRERIADVNLIDADWRRSNDMHLVTWLRGRDYNLKKAEEMFRKSDAWWKQHDIANIWKNWKPPAEYCKKFAVTHIGCDADDNPILFLRPGRWDLRSAIEADGRDMYLKYNAYIVADVVEKFRQLQKEKGRFIGQFIVILDMSGFALRQLTSYATVQAHLECVRQFEANFPETLKAAYVININNWFLTLFNLTKPLLSGKTLGKIAVFGSNSNKWESVLKNSNWSIDCSIFDSEYKEDKDEIDFEMTTVKAGDKFKMSFYIEETKSRLTWKFKTEEHDIGFGIKFFDAYENSSTELIPIQRKSSNFAVQENSIICSNPGKYTVIFDNTYSRFRSKTLYYSINIHDDDIQL